MFFSPAVDFTLGMFRVLVSLTVVVCISYLLVSLPFNWLGQLISLIILKTKRKRK